MCGGVPPKYGQCSTRTILWFLIGLIIMRWILDGQLSNIESVIDLLETILRLVNDFII